MNNSKAEHSARKKAKSFNKPFWTPVLMLAVVALIMISALAWDVVAKYMKETSSDASAKAKTFC